jgi:hypothetical protein
MVYLIAKARGIDDHEGDTRSFLIKLELWCRHMSAWPPEDDPAVKWKLTDGDGFDLHALLDMGAIRVVGLLVSKNRFATQGVHEGRSACRGFPVSLSAPLTGTEVWIGVGKPVPEAPQTIKQNWMPFLTFFLRRIIFYSIENCSSAIEHRKPRDILGTCV